MKRLLSVLAVFVTSTLIVALLTRFMVWKSRNRLLRKVDVFAEPLKERVNEFIDIIAVVFDKMKESVSVIFEQKKTKSVKIEGTGKTAPGRYVRVKV